MSGEQWERAFPPFLLPIRTVSEANQREHWAVKAKRKKQQTNLAALVTCSVVSQRWLFARPARITLTRYGVRRLDADNLAGSFKGIQDGIAAALGMDDGDERLTWVYAQEKGNKSRIGVVVTIEVDATWKAKGATG